VNDDDPAGRGLPDDSPDDGTEDMRRYQGTPSAGVRVLRAIRVPGALLLIGFALTVVGPVPGLGVFLVLGAGLATFVIGMTALVGR
jgi:hypothetical protein